MLPEPIHPMIVHFPIVFVTVLPLVALLALYAIHRGISARRAWTIPLVLAVLLSVSAFLAVRTGEAQEEVVEEVIGGQVLHGHEEAGERFLVFSGVLSVVALAGLLGGTPGRAARIVATGGAFVLLLAGIQVGHSGGELVYRHGAANAWTQPGGVRPDVAQSWNAPEGRH